MERTNIIDGHAIADAFLGGLASQIREEGLQPQLAIIQVGEHPASEAYIRRKNQSSALVGIKSTHIRLDETVSPDALLGQIKALNADRTIHGILVQTPLPGAHDTLEVFRAIAPEKDVDGFHPFNMGKLIQGDLRGPLPCTPLGIQLLLKAISFDTAGKKVVIVGRSVIVGKPMGLMLLSKGALGDATVTYAHSKTKDLASQTKQADLLIVAAGVAHMIHAEHVKEGATVIDVGINRVEDDRKKAGFRLVGDVDFESVSPKAGAITPVPGGVGPMTVAALMHNVTQACRMSYLKAAN